MMMRSCDNEEGSASGSGSAYSSFGRGIFGMRRDQVHSLEASNESSSRDVELESFQKQVTDRFQDLCGVSDDELLSIDWLRKLLDAFICCHDEFTAILFTTNKEQLSKSPLLRSISAFFERSLKALDICNASRYGIDKIRMWLKHVDIVLCALDANQRQRHRAFSEGQFRRARKALMDLALAMVDDKDSRSCSFFSQLNLNGSSGRHSRSHSWSVSPSWSAAKRLHSIASNLVPPGANDIVATSGLAIPIYTMSSLLLFVLWALVAAIPCQDRGLKIHFSVPRQFSWAVPVTSLHQRIMDESKKRERRNLNALLKEMNQVEKCTKHITNLVDSLQFPLKDEQKMQLEHNLEELTLVCQAFRDGLDPLERRLKEVFWKIMTCRTQGLDYLGTPDQ